jgi:hypothetical protein
MQPAFPEEPTRVSFRRFVAHLVDGIVATLLFLVVAIPAGMSRTRCSASRSCSS